jgi:hypothetical protein
MDRNKGKKPRRSKRPIPPTTDLLEGSRKPSHNREVLSLLLNQVAQVLAFLTPTHQRHQHHLGILRGAATNPHSVLDKLDFLGAIAAASRNHFAVGGPDPTLLRRYIDQCKLAGAVAKYNTAKATLRCSNPKTLDAAELRRCAYAFQEFVTAEAGVIDVFRTFQSEVISSLEICADKTDSNRDKNGTGRISLPRNVDVYRLAKLINETKEAEGSQIAVARQFTEGAEKKARSLLRQLRRYSNLLERPRT